MCFSVLAVLCVSALALVDQNQHEDQIKKIPLDWICHRYEIIVLWDFLSAQGEKRFMGPVQM